MLHLASVRPIQRASDDIFPTLVVLLLGSGARHVPIHLQSGRGKIQPCSSIKTSQFCREHFFPSLNSPADVQGKPTRGMGQQCYPSHIFFIFSKSSSMLLA